MNKQTRQIIKWYNAGLTTKEIGKKLNKCGEYVRIVLVKNNIPRRNGLTKEQIQQIIKWYNNGLTTPKIGALVNRSAENIRYVLSKNGIARRQKCPPSSETIQQVVSWRLTGLTCKEIGDKIGKSKEYVRKIVSKNGFTRNFTVSRKKLSLSQENDIVNKYLSGGQSTQSILKEYGIGETLLYTLLKERNIKANKYLLETRIDSQKEKEICQQYRDGISSYQLDKLHKISIASVLKILKKNHVLIRPPEIVSQKYIPVLNYFKKINTPEKAYIFGMLLSDGNIYKRKISLTLQNCDAYLLELLSKILCPDKQIRIFNRQKYGVNCSGFVITDKRMSDSLKKIGMVERKSLILEYPYNVIPKKLFGHFLRGYFDGDGCIYLNKKNRVAAFIITSGSLSFLQSLKIEIEKIIDEKIPKVYKHKYGWFDIRSSKISVLHKIYDLMYPPNLNHLYLTRKKEKFQDVIEIL